MTLSIPGHIPKESGGGRQLRCQGQKPRIGCSRSGGRPMGSTKVLPGPFAPGWMGICHSLLRHGPISLKPRGRTGMGGSGWSSLQTESHSFQGEADGDGLPWEPIRPVTP